LPKFKPKIAKIEAQSLAQVEAQNCPNWGKKLFEQIFANFGSFLPFEEN